MQPGSSVDAQSMALSACIYHSFLGHLPEYDRGIKRARFAVLRLTKVPAVLIEGGFLTERGESKLISNKDWRAKLAGAIGVGIENYQALPVKKQPPMLVADYRRQTKSAPVEPVIQEGGMKEADASLLELVGRSAFLSQRSRRQLLRQQHLSNPLPLSREIVVGRRVAAFSASNVSNWRVGAFGQSADWP